MVILTKFKYDTGTVFMEYERVASALNMQDQQILDAPHCATGMLC